MNSQKTGSDLNLALEATEEERERSLNLNVGYDREDRIWELIVKYSGSLERIASDAVQVTELTNEYAILKVREPLVETLAALPEIEYIEKPHRLYFQRENGKRVSCVNPVQRAPLSLTGKGVLVAVLDSGVDYTHPEFRNADGTTRILAYWDQTGSGTSPEGSVQAAGGPPVGFHQGVEYTRAQMNEVLTSGNRLPISDGSGHGTGVAAIAAGNGGVAPDSELLVVELGIPGETGFPRTTELMEGLDYVLRKALEYRMPVAVNISFGNTYGSHRGTSLLETYLDDMSSRWKNVICVGSGNEGNRAGHTAGNLTGVREQLVELTVASYEPALSIQIWKNYVDRFRIYLTAPDGTTVGPFYERPPAQRYLAGRTELLVYYGEPGPYSVDQEIFIEMIPLSGYIDAGVWTIRLVSEKIVDGIWQMWLPGSVVLGTDTRFLRPVEETTLTIPSTASKVLTVGAYDALTNAYADFSGRGGRNGIQKPDLVAPGVEILTAAPGGGYLRKNGTSFAVPFVTGAAALLMQYGITDGNDPYLYGEKVKAYLRRGAAPLPGIREYPDERVGYGRLCILEAFPRSSVPPFV